jgi:hypothetical protein
MSLDNKVQQISDECDRIRDKLSDMRRYNRNTALLVAWLWGLGLPLSFLVAILYLSRS